MINDTIAQIQQAKDYAAGNALSLPQNMRIIYETILRTAYRAAINTKLAEAKKCGPEDAMQLMADIRGMAAAGKIDVLKELSTLERKIYYSRMRF